MHLSFYVQITLETAMAVLSYVVSRMLFLPNSCQVHSIIIWIASWRCHKLGGGVRLEVNWGWSSSASEIRILSLDMLNFWCSIECSQPNSIFRKWDNPRCFSSFMTMVRPLGERRDCFCHCLCFYLCFHYSGQHYLKLYYLFTFLTVSLECCEKWVTLSSAVF